jgi:hypothetical protein
MCVCPAIAAKVCDNSTDEIEGRTGGTMLQPISDVSHTQASQDSSRTAAARQAAPQPKPEQPPPAATVKLSAAASAIQEATESSVQTAKEANAGDIQARNLQAREAAAKAESE